MGRKDVKLNVYVEDTDKQKLEEMAEKDGTSLAAIIRKLIRVSYEQRLPSSQPPPPQNNGH
jgi:hypothetical protein